MPMRATKASHFPPSLADIQFKALSMPATSRRPSSMRIDVTDRIRCEFVEMRGFSPTVDQAARLFQVSREECVRVLKKLVDEGFLRQTNDGRYRLPPQQ
jgi:CRP-like cAMP-binding protein